MLCLVRMKACKRCGGDVSLECDVYGVYAECIQCGATWYQKTPKIKFISNTDMDTPMAKTSPQLIADRHD